MDPTSEQSPPQAPGAEPATTQPEPQEEISLDFLDGMANEEAPPEEEIDDGSTPTTVELRHKFFASFPGMFFAKSEQGGEPSLYVKLTEYEVTLPLVGIRREFNIADASRDGRVLNLVADALDYVKGLRMGDPLPKEVYSQGASWEPSVRDRTIAYHRLTMQLVTWLSGNEHVISNPEELLQVAQDPNAQRKINEAFSQAAERLGIGKARKQDVVTYIEQLAAELAYIEALRQRYKQVIDLDNQIQGLRRIYGTERSVLEIADPVARLMQVAKRQFKDSFDDIDAQTGEILSVLKNIHNQIKFINHTRNGLYRRLLAWEEVMEKWKGVPVCRSMVVPDLFRDTYHFLAPRFMQVKEWALVTQPDKEKKKFVNRTMIW